MKFLIAPSAYKGSLSASQLAHAIASGIRRCKPDALVDLAPIADGGDGTIEALNTAFGGTLKLSEVAGAVGQPTKAAWIVLGAADSQSDHPTAVVELASACGLAGLGGRLAPLEASTVGAGQVLRACLDCGYKKIVMTVGGSASTDGGMGALTALGVKFYDSAGAILPAGGGWLKQINSIDLTAVDALHNHLVLDVATDVINPLLGGQGAAVVFAPQKGASVEQVRLLEEGLYNFADLIEKMTGRSVRDVKGAGAAGGTAFGLATALGARIIPGFEWLSGLIKLEERLKDSDVVVSAEGRLDTQSLSGKATGELASLCRRYDKPFVMLPATCDTTVNWSSHGVSAVFPSAKPGQFATIADVAASAELIGRILPRSG